MCLKPRRIWNTRKLSTPSTQIRGTLGWIPINLDPLIRLLTGWARWQWLTGWDSLASVCVYNTQIRVTLGWIPNNLDLLIRLLTGWARWQWLTSWDSLADLYSWRTTPRYGLRWVDSLKPGSFDQVTHRLSGVKWNHTQIHLPLFSTSNTQIRVKIGWFTQK